MGINIIYNQSVEFINGIGKYAGIIRENEWKTGTGNNIDKTGLIFKDLLDFTPNAYVNDWIESIDNTISAFVKNDMDLLFNQFSISTSVLLELIISRNIKTPDTLIQVLKNENPEELLESFWLFLELPLHLKEDETGIRQHLIDNWGSDIAGIFMQLYRQPKDFIQKLSSILDYFYTVHFKPIENKIEGLLLPKIKAHKALLDKDPLYFINIIGIGDYKKYIDSNHPITLYISFITDVGMYYFTYQDTLFMVYGVNMEKRFDDLIMKEKCKNLFKALSDEKRLEIIKLTSQRPYYNKELADHFGLTTATLSYHINLLLDLGILNFEPRPNNRFYYTTNKETLRMIFNQSLDMLME